MAEDNTTLAGGLGEEPSINTDGKADVEAAAKAKGTPDAETPADAAAAPAAPAPKEPTVKREVKYKHGPEAQKSGWWWGTGRRKTAVARVRLRPGTGIFLINKREINDYFTEPRDREDAVAPLKSTETFGELDVHVNIKGGGYMGQAGAILLGVARALRVYDCSLEQVLRDNGYLTRDAREVERKKPGQPGARRRFQFSKR